jgi:hypothetical protein
MSIYEWLQTYYFWLPFTFVVVAVGLIALFEHINRKRTCPTCFSDRWYKRNSVEYTFSKNFKTVEPCADRWHELTKRK